MKTFPEYFGNDIQARDTNVFPLLTIGSVNEDWGNTAWYPDSFFGDWATSFREYLLLSTSHYSGKKVTTDATVFKFTPIILNISNSRESLDFKGKLKISSITVELSNSSYNGMRFSEAIEKMQKGGAERLHPRSLEGMEAQIRWASQQASGFTSNEVNFVSFSGVIVKYEHSKDKVKLTIEDQISLRLSDKVFPRKNPEEDAILSDRHGDKIIPMVFGEVDRSPALFIAGFEELIVERSTDVQFQQETSVFSSVNNTYATVNNVVSPLYINQDGTYINVYEDNADSYKSDNNQKQFSYYKEDDEDAVFIDPNKILLNINNPNIFSTFDDTGAGGVLRCTDKSKNISINLTNPIHHPDGQSMDFTDDLNGLYGIIDSSDGVNPIEFQSTISINNFSNVVIDEVIHKGDLILFYDHDNDGITMDFRTVWDINPVYFRYEFLLLSLRFNYATPYDYEGDVHTIGFNINGINLNDYSPNTSPDEGANLVFGVPIFSYGFNAMENIQQGDPVSGVTERYPNYLGLGDWALWTSLLPFGDAGTVTWEQLHDLFYFEQLADDPIAIPDAPFKINVEGEIEAGISDVFTAHLTLNANFKEVEILREVDASNVLAKDFYVNIIGRGGEIPHVPGIINTILEEMWEGDEEYPWSESSQSVIGDDSEYGGWRYGFTIDEEKDGRKFIEELLSVSPYMMRYDSTANTIKYLVTKERYLEEDIAGSLTIKNEDIIDFSFSKTDINEVYDELTFEYNWDYGTEKFNSSYTFNWTTAQQLNDHGIIYDPKYHGRKHGNNILLINDDRGKYIRDEGTAESFAKWMFYKQCNQHLKIKITLPLKYMNIETGDLLSFDEIIGGVKPYGINYAVDANFPYTDAWNEEASAIGAEINGQQAYPLFMVNSISKGIKSVQLECTQLHNLYDGDYTRGDLVFGCMDSAAWNYDPDAVEEPNVEGGGCIYPGNFVVPANDWGCPYETHGGEIDEVGDPYILDYSTNFAGNGPNSEWFLDDNGDPLGPEHGVFISTNISEETGAYLDEEGNDLTSAPNGAAYLYWFEGGGTPKIYQVSSCNWQDTKPHDINYVAFHWLRNDTEDWSSGLNPGSWQIDPHSSNYNLIDPHSQHNFAYGGLDQYLHNDTQLLTRVTFRLRRHSMVNGVLTDFAEDEDFTFAGDNHLSFQILSEVNGEDNVPIGSGIIQNFTMDDDASDEYGAGQYDESYMVTSEDILIDVSDLVALIEANPFDDHEFNYKIVYTLSIGTDPPYTEVYRSTADVGEPTSPLFGTILMVGDPVTEDCSAYEDGVAGDVNQDGDLNVLDVQRILFYMLNPGDYPFTYCEFETADYNEDGVLNILDIVNLVEIILWGR